MQETGKVNLLDVGFIPTTDGVITLKEAFEPAPRRLAGDPLKRIMSLKLMLAVAQSALRPKTAEDLKADTKELGLKCRAYLECWRSRFDIDDEAHPFLQFPELEKGTSKVFPALRGIPDFLPGENTVVVSSRSLTNRAMTDEERIWSVLHAVTVPYQGRKWDKQKGLAGEYAAPRKCTASASFGSTGYLHTFIEGRTLLDTVRLNLLAEEDLVGLEQYRHGIGRAPWEDMNQFRSSSCEEIYRHTLMGRLVPMSRYVWLGTMMHGVLGLDCLPIGEKGFADPSVTVLPTTKATAAVKFYGLSCDSSMYAYDWQFALRALGFWREKGEASFSGPKSLVAEKCLPRAAGDEAFVGIWAGGRSIANKKGENVDTFGDKIRSAVISLREPHAVLEKGAALTAAVRRTEAAQDAFFEILKKKPEEKALIRANSAETIRAEFDRCAERLFAAPTREEGADAFAEAAEMLSAAFENAAVTSFGRGRQEAARLRPYFADLYPEQIKEDTESEN